MASRVRQGFQVAGFAVRSPAAFARALREAGRLILDRELADASPLPVVPAGLMRRLGAVDISVPASDFFVNGTQSVEGLRVLVAISKTLGAHRVFEIGTFTGLTALTLAANLPQLIVHTLDLPAASSPALEVEKNDRLYIPSQPRRRVFEGRPEAARIIQHEGDSGKFDFLALGRKFDLVYVDGAHSYDYVANDTRAAFNMVADGGAIVWDDYQPGWPGVVRYLNGRTDLALYRAPGTHLVLWLSDRAKSILFAT
jgi:predicted O-methyltransferase YrrM